MCLKNILQQNVNNYLQEGCVPELKLIQKGKVRESYKIGKKRLLITSDRISAYDRIMARGIPFKGQVLNQLACFWFEQTQDIVANHLLESPDPNVMLVHECKTYPVEVVVRRYLVGGAWRSYQKSGSVSGIRLKPGLKEFQQLPSIIITPSTKSHEGHDEEISREEILKKKLVAAPVWRKIEKTAIALFQRGASILKKRGLTLVDTKYEFGSMNGKLVLIDEIHTPDSSRFWGDWGKDLDKEYLRRWLREKHKFLGDGPIPALTDPLVVEIARRYIHIYETVTGNSLEISSLPVADRLRYNLQQANLIHGTMVVILMASGRDEKCAKAVVQELKKYKIPNTIRVGSAHKTPEDILILLAEYEKSIEPIVYITIAGRADALSGLVAANTRHPVISCPPDFNTTDVFSSIRTPSYVPPMLVLNPENAALAAAKIFRSPHVPGVMKSYKEHLRRLDKGYRS